MTATKPERPFVVITSETTREELAETIGLLNGNAKRIHRRGYVGTASAEYERAHDRLNALLDDYEAWPT